MLAAVPAVASSAPSSHALSEVRGAAALSWVDQQNQRTFAALEADPRYRGFHDSVLRIRQDAHRIPVPAFLGGAIFNLWQDAAHPRGIWRDATPESFLAGQPAWTTRLDVDDLARREHRDWVFQGADCLAPDDSPCLIQLSEGGEDATTLREFAPLSGGGMSGGFVPGGFLLPRSKQDVAWQDRDTLLVARDWGEGRPVLPAGR